MITPEPASVPLRDRLFLLVGASTWIALTGVLDYASGVEIRIFPLYFLPIILVGWRLGLGTTLFVAWLSAAVWLLSNYQAGMQFSSEWVWVVNTVTQGISFSVVGALMVVARRAYRLAEGRSRTDSLTGLLNAGAFRAEATRIAAICERHHWPLTVAYLDLDEFKQVNDKHGHAEGDRVLSLVGRALHEVARETDLVARLGGDEFAMAMSDTNAAGAEVALSRLRARLAHTLSEAPRPVTVSIGAVVSASQHGSVDDLLKRADASLYKAKAEGKDRFVIVAPPAAVPPTAAPRP